MVSAPNSRSRGPGLSLGLGHCVVFLDETLYSHSASLHTGVQMGTREMLGLSIIKCLGVICDGLASYREGAALRTLLVASC